MTEKSTNLPCPGCGYEPSYKSRPGYRLVGSVCGECRNKLEAYDRLVAETEGTDLVKLVIPWAAHAMQHIPHDKVEGDPFRNPEDLRRRFHRILPLLGKVLKRYEVSLDEVELPLGERYGRADEVVLVSRELAEAMVHLYERLPASMEAAWAEGHSTGRRLLHQLAQGELTTADFDDRVARRED